MEQELNKFDKLRVNPDSFEKIKNLHENLYYGAVKALLGQVKVVDDIPERKIDSKKLPENTKKFLKRKHKFYSFRKRIKIFRKTFLTRKQL